MASSRRTSQRNRSRGRASSSRQRAPYVVAGNPSMRMAVVFGLFLLVVLFFVGRLFYLTLIVGPENAETAISGRTETITVEAKRGTIYDRNGNVLATSVDATTIYCNPSEVTDPSGLADTLVQLFGGVKSDYTKKLASTSTFVYLCKKADVDVASKLKDMGYDGVYFLSDSKRVYPYGQTAGQVIGLCDTDGNGIAGLELYYDDVLSGEDGEIVAEYGKGGYPIAGGQQQTVAATDGQDIVVSIDIEMQEYLEERLTQAVSDIEGKRGDSVIYDGATGDILAIASTPYLNPSDRSTVEEGATTLMPINTMYEPGSIFKSVTMAAVLEAGVLTPESEIYCPAYLEADEYTVSDAHTRASQTFTLTQILAESSNVGTSLAASELGFGPLYDKILEYGFAQKTGVDFPGESAGSCTEQSTWSLVRSYNVSFGQGISVTPLQMARFYGALANDGVAYQPHFLLSYPQTGEEPTYEGTKLITSSTVDSLTGMLEAVVTEGTGTKAAIDGYSVAGKTGTAQYADDSGTYVDGSYDISFIGYLPDTDSDLVCFVGVTEVPGDRSTAAAFKDIMAFAINHYKIAAQ
ncbi:MAG: penicillin-binding protein 2 [Eggerthellaceae bacterium]|nr:penicillin-binding protein 2 [Eggerthellaceae bacterium]